MKKSLYIISLLFILPAIAVAVQHGIMESMQTMGNEWTGDYEQMVERRVIRALVPYNKTFYFLDGAKPKGLTYEGLREFEKTINESLSTRHLKVHVIVIPTPRDELIPSLKKGKGDIAAGNLTITSERSKLVDFTNPLLKNVSEIIVTGPSSSSIKTVSDLSGKVIHVRKSSSYYESLVKLNKKFSDQGRKKINIVEASEYLEDEDLLEMLNAGLIPMMIIDSHKGKFWAQIFNNITLQPHIKLRGDGEIAWAIRKNSPQLKKIINEFVLKNKKGTLLGNIMFKRYLKNTKYIRNNNSQEDRKRFTSTIALFKKYAQTYQFDYLMLVALGYQESNLDQSKRSHVGAVGVMQLMPETAKDKNVGIPNIEKIESNIHAGTKYLRFIINRYFNDPDIDDLNKGLLAFASYNAGPNRITKLRKEAAKLGLNPNVWFRNVEVIAAKRIGRETVQYVSNIYKYYLSYRLLTDHANVKQSNKK